MDEMKKQTMQSLLIKIVQHTMVKHHVGDIRCSSLTMFEACENRVLIEQKLIDKYTKQLEEMANDFTKNDSK